MSTFALRSLQEITMAAFSYPENQPEEANEGS